MLYSVRYLHVFLCGFAVLVPPLRPPLAVLCGHHTPADTHLEIFLSWSEFSEGQLSLFWRPWFWTTERKAQFVVLRTKAIFIWRIIPVLLSLNGYVDIDLSTYVQFFSDSDRYPLRGKDECTLKMKFARTNTFKFSFFNRIVDMWTHSTIACSSGNN